MRLISTNESQKYVHYTSVQLWMFLYINHSLSKVGVARHYTMTEHIQNYIRIAYNRNAHIFIPLRIIALTANFSPGSAVQPGNITLYDTDELQILYVTHTCTMEREQICAYAFGAFLAHSLSRKHQV